MRTSFSMGRWFRIGVPSSLLVAAISCTSSSETEPHQTEAPKRAPEAQPITSDRPAAGIAAQDHAQVVVQPVTWPADRDLDAAARAALSTRSLEAVDRAPVPVLVVARPELLERSVVMAKDAWYALSAQHDGVTVSLSATRAAHHYANTPKVRGDRRVRGQDAFVTQNEAIWSASWLENKIAYVLEVECGGTARPTMFG